MSKLQEILTKTMAQAGRVVEKVAQGIPQSKKKVKPRKTGVTDEAGEDFSAIPWEDRHLQALLSGAERAHLYSLIPDLDEKSSLHLTPNPASQYLALMEKRRGQNIVELDVAKSSIATQAPEAKEHRFARGSVEKLPFREQTFDFILYPSALAWRSDLPALIEQASFCLKDNGRLLFSTIHPFFEYLMSPRGGVRKNIGPLFANLKQHGFFVDELKEANLEESLRVVSLPAKLEEQLRRFPGMPILLLMRGILVRRRKR